MPRLVIRARTVAEAWRQAFMAAVDSPQRELIPLVVTITPEPGWSPAETSLVRDALDARLTVTKGAVRTATGAGLIFPSSLWERYRERGREFFFAQFRERTALRLRAADKRNAGGTYFERLVAYGPESVNQLKAILDARQSGTMRRSLLQAVVFDPRTDHSARPYLPFPCLDYVAFAPTRDGGLSMTAFYATQYLFDRAFGNYLGLCALGIFIAEQLELTFRRLTCVAGVATLGKMGSVQAQAFANELTSMRSASGPDEERRARESLLQRS